MPRGHIHGRLEKLEASLGRIPHNGNSGARERLINEFFRRSLDAIAHIRRTAIDDTRWRYSLERLKGEAPVTVAAYVAALTQLQHPDEDEAREHLTGLAAERQLDAAALMRCVDAFLRFGRTRGEG